MADDKDVKLSINTTSETPTKDASYKSLKTQNNQTSSKVRLTRDTTSRRLDRYLSAADAASPMSIEFDGMYAHVPSTPGSKEKKTILHGVSGKISSGEFVALMGPSGAGKSTLLNVLGLRFEEDYSGKVLINGLPRTKQSKRSIGYVLQNDVILPNLTVFETLNITAKLRLPQSMTQEQKIERVNDIIYLMGLKTCENTMVQSVSGGEKKRVSIANEMIINPSVLFLDEPTSGLDSTSAYSILSTLQSLSKQGRTIICAIHQPSSQMFAKFDKLVLLASGKIVYFGDTITATDYFGDECGYPCPIHYNPADFILELVTDNFASENKSLQNKEEIKIHLIECWQNKIDGKPIIPANSDNNNNNKTEGLNEPNDTDVEIETELTKIETETNKVSNNEITSKDKWPLNWFEQFMILLVRALKVRKGHTFSKLRTFEMCSVAIISGFIWFRMDKTDENLSDWVGAAFFIQIYVQFMTMYRGLIHFPAEKMVIKRERQSGYYRLTSYYVSKLVAELPIDVALPLLAVTILYWMAGFNDNFGIYIIYLIVTTLGVATANAFGTLIGCLVMNFEHAMTILAVLGLFMMLSGGFYIAEDEMPIWISWLKYISFMRYQYLITINIILTNLEFTCLEPSSYEICNSVGYLNKSDILDIRQISEPLYLSIILQFLCLVVWHVVAYSFLRRNTSVREQS